MELSSSTETNINLPFITADASGPKHLDVKLTRAKLESLVADLLDNLEGPCKKALKEANLGSDGVDEVVLVGGMTRMPAVQQRVEKIFGKNPIKALTRMKWWPWVQPYRPECFRGTSTMSCCWMSPRFPWESRPWAVL